MSDRIGDVPPKDTAFDPKKVIPGTEVHSVSIQDVLYPRPTLKDLHKKCEKTANPYAELELSGDAIIRLPDGKSVLIYKKRDGTYGVSVIRKRPHYEAFSFRIHTLYTKINALLTYFGD